MKNLLIVFFTIPLVMGCEIVGTVETAESKEQLKVLIQEPLNEVPARATC